MARKVLDERKQWWTNILAILETHHSEIPLFFLMDANAKSDRLARRWSLTRMMHALETRIFFA